MHNNSHGLNHIRQFELPSSLENITKGYLKLGLFSFNLLYCSIEMTLSWMGISEQS
jgi:hypothetical protein